MNTVHPPRATHPLAFEFVWDAAEHRQLLREIGRHRERSRGESVFWWALAVLLGIVAVSVLVEAVERGNAGWIVPFLP